jgi:co-chaperonin GroES (HSP10)
MEQMKQMSVADRPKRFKVKPVISAGGIVPVEFKVVVRPVKVSDTFATKSGITLYKPIETKDQEQASTMEGDLVAISPLAFTYEEWPAGFDKPAVGERVIFARYAGATAIGDDGEELRIMNDKDIMAVRRSAE